MSFDWRDLPAADFDRHFNPRAVIPDAQAFIDGYTARSAQARKHVPGIYDVRYGKRPKETLDLHQPEGGGSARPLVVFLHGGFWRALDKSDHTFLVPPVLASGAVVANVNYDLCPTVTLDVIVEEITAAIAFCHAQARGWGADPGNMILIGHSAGAHLAAAMLQRQWSREVLPADAIRGVAALTGIYEPQLILNVSVNAEAQITEEVALRHDCLARPFVMKPRMVIAAGAEEPEGWIAQTELFAAACVAAGMDTSVQLVASGNHFTTLERAFEDGHPLRDAVFGLWR